jgi:hypothetical protein
MYKTRGPKRARYLMAGAMTAVAGLLAAAPVLAAPPDQIHEFTVITDTVQTSRPTQCASETCRRHSRRARCLQAGNGYAYTRSTDEAPGAADGSDRSGDRRIVTFTLPNLPGQLGSEAPDYLNIPSNQALLPEQLYRPPVPDHPAVHLH